LASPINKDVLKTVSGTTSLSPDVYPFRIQHEATTVELFYDLFFVANLAYFTSIHQHTDASGLNNYAKLFTMTWFTWLCVTLFDTRFAVDSVWNRFNKAVQFFVMTMWVYTGVVYDETDDPKSDARSYRNFAITLAVGRFAIALQYFVVMYQSRVFRHTLVPVGLSGLVHAVAGTAFIIQLFVIPMGAVDDAERDILCVILIPFFSCDQF
jgi:low temperature requirement protein LtrA